MRHDGLAGPKLLGEPDRAGDVDAGRAAEAKPLVFKQVVDHGHGLLVRDEVSFVDLGVAITGVTRPRPIPSVIEPPGVDLATPFLNNSYIAAPVRIGAGR